MNRKTKKRENIFKQIKKNYWHVYIGVLYYRHKENTTYKRKTIKQSETADRAAEDIYMQTRKETLN